MPHGTRNNLFGTSARSLIVGSGRFFPGSSIFSSLRSPDHLWGPPSPLFNECWGISAQEYCGRGMRLPGLVQRLRTCETTPIKNKLLLFERKVLRKIFGATEERDGTWRIKTSDELDKLIRHKNIINFIKAQSLSWFGLLHRMSEERMVNKSI